MGWTNNRDGFFRTNWDFLAGAVASSLDWNETRYEDFTVTEIKSSPLKHFLVERRYPFPFLLGRIPDKVWELYNLQTINRLLLRNDRAPKKQYKYRDFMVLWLYYDYFRVFQEGEVFSFDQTVVSCHALIIGGPGVGEFWIARPTAQMGRCSDRCRVQLGCAGIDCVRTQCIYLSTYLPTYLSIYLSFYLSFFLSFFLLYLIYLSNLSLKTSIHARTSACECHLYQRRPVRGFWLA